MSVLLVYMVDLRVTKASLDEEGIKDGYVEGNVLSVSELTRIVTAIFVNQSGEFTALIASMSLLPVNWFLTGSSMFMTRKHKSIIV